MPEKAGIRHHLRWRILPAPVANPRWRILFATGGDYHNNQAFAGGEYHPNYALAGGEYHPNYAYAGGEYHPDNALAGGEYQPNYA